MDGEHGTPLLENHEKAHSLQPLRRSPRFQGNLGEVLVLYPIPCLIITLIYN